MASDILRELKVVLRLEDKATKETKTAAEELAKTIKDSQGGLQDLISIKNAILGGALAGLAAFLGDAAQKFTALSRSVEQASFRFRTTESSTRDLTEQVRNLGKESIYSTDELVKALGNIQGAGVTTAEAMQLLSLSEQAAAATGSNLGSVTGGVSQILQEYSDSSLTAQQVTQLLTNASVELGIPMEALISLLLNLAPKANAAKASLDDIVGALVLLKDIPRAQALELIQTSLDAIGGNTQAISQIALITDGFSVKPGVTTLDEVLRAVSDGLQSLDPAKAQALGLFLKSEGKEGLAGLVVNYQEAFDKIGKLIDTYVAKVQELEQTPIPQTRVTPLERLGKDWDRAVEGVGGIVAAGFVNPGNALAATVGGAYGSLFGDENIKQKARDELNALAEIYAAGGAKQKKVDDERAYQTSESARLLAEFNKNQSTNYSTTDASAQKLIESLNKTTIALEAAAQKINSIQISPGGNSYNDYRNRTRP